MKEITSTLPASWYYNPEIFESERKTIFSSEWLYVAEEIDLKKTGDYLTFELAGYPLLLLVGEDQKLRAFHNVCRHRAAPILTEKKGCLKTPTVSCRYHGWTYDLAGELIQAPMFDTSAIKKCELSLFEIQVGVLNGLVFINMDPAAPSFDQAFSPVKQEIERSGFPMTEYTTYSAMSREGQFNWKVWVDGYQECYHCTTIHPIFNKDFQLKNYRVENKDGYSVHSCDRKSQSNLGKFEGLWLWIYPNLGMPCYEPCFYSLQVNPLSVNRTQLNYRFRFHSSVDEATRNEFIETIKKITQEDITICEMVQKNLEAGIYQSGLLNPDRENGVAYFQKLVRQAVSVGSTRPGLPLTECSPESDLKPSQLSS